MRRRATSVLKWFSGLYVVLAVVSGPNADRILREMIQGARFGDTSVSQIVKAAGRLQ